MAFMSKELFDDEGRIKEPVKSIIDLVIIGYRPVTSLSILALLVENQNKPMYGAQIGAQLERRFELPKGWFTKTRYYDTRVAKLLKILQRQGIMEEVPVRDIRANKGYVGYRVAEPLYPSVKEAMLSFLKGESLSIFIQQKRDRISVSKPSGSQKRCSKCNFLACSSSAKYCELCGAPLTTNCPSCQKEMSLEYSFCLNCGNKLA